MTLAITQEQTRENKCLSVNQDVRIEMRVIGKKENEEVDNRYTSWCHDKKEGKQQNQVWESKSLLIFQKY